MHNKTWGWINGLIGVIIFSGSLPTTRIAVQDLNPWFVTSARACIAAILAGALLLLFKQTKPSKADLPALIWAAIGVILGFPLLTALALQYTHASHTIVFVGLLPLMTALFAVLRAGERPKPFFWMFSSMGAASVIGYALLNSGSAPWFADVLMLLAIMVCGLGYAEGAKLSRHLGGWQVISWALLLAFPALLILMLLTFPSNLSHISSQSWWSLAYLSLFSMLLGFVFWYKGLVQGGIAAVGQLQLLQPFMGLGLAALLLNESIDVSMLLTTTVAAICVYYAKKYAY